MTCCMLAIVTRSGSDDRLARGRSAKRLLVCLRLPTKNFYVTCTSLQHIPCCIYSFCLQNKIYSCCQILTTPIRFRSLFITRTVFPCLDQISLQTQLGRILSSVLTCVVSNLVVRHVTLALNARLWIACNPLSHHGYFRPLG